MTNRRQAALKAWKTIRAKQNKRSNAAKEGKCYSWTKGRRQAALRAWSTRKGL